MKGLDIAAIRAALEADQARLTADIEEFEKADRETLSDASGENNYRDHMADQGSATFARELDMTLEDNARRALDDIEKALARIDNGTYGICVRCSLPINLERLEVMPEAELCLMCKAREESE